MTLRLKINLIVGALTVLFIAAVIWPAAGSMRESVHEETVAAQPGGRPAAEPHRRGVMRRRARRRCWRSCRAWGGSARTTSRCTTRRAQELYRSPPSPYKAGRDAPAVVRRLAGAAGVGAGDRLPGRQAGGARECLARGARRLGLCAAPGRRRGGVARGRQRAGVLARRARGASRSARSCWR